MKDEILKALAQKSESELEALYKISLEFTSDQLLKIPKTIKKYKSIIIQNL